MMGLPPARVLSGYGIVIGWWLRSPGSSASSAANVNNNGSLGNNNVNNDNEVVRPAFPNCLKFVPAKDDPVPEKAVPWGGKEYRSLSQGTTLLGGLDPNKALGKICRRRPGRQAK